jgi:hypothetical protein
MVATAKTSSDLEELSQFLDDSIKVINPLFMPAPL